MLIKKNMKKINSHFLYKRHWKKPRGFLLNPPPPCVAFRGFWPDPPSPLENRVVSEWSLMLVKAALCHATLRQNSQKKFQSCVKDKREVIETYLLNQKVSKLYF